MRLIDADRLRKIAVNDGDMFMVCEIDKAPTVTEILFCGGDKEQRFIKERPHGKAIYKDFDKESGVRNSWWCSCCGFPLVQVYMSFCGNCGAELKKEGEAE